MAHKRAVVLRLIAGVPVFKLERWCERAEAAYLARQAAQGLAPRAADRPAAGRIPCIVHDLRTLPGTS